MSTPPTSKFPEGNFTISVSVPKPAPAEFDSLKGDVVVLSSDKVGFPFRRAQLVAGSIVFESLFDTTDEGKTLESLAGSSPSLKMVRTDSSVTIPMSETADKVEVFLRHIGRDLKRPLHLEITQIEESVQSVFLRVQSWAHPSCVSSATPKDCS